MLLGVLGHLFWALTALKSPKTAKTPVFPPFASYNSAPWWLNPNPPSPFPAAWPKLPFLQVSSKYSNFKGNLLGENPRTNAPYRRLRRPSIPESEPPRFARWLNNDNPEIHCAFMGHGPNPKHLGDEGQ